MEDAGPGRVELTYRVCMDIFLLIHDFLLTVKTRWDNSSNFKKYMSKADKQQCGWFIHRINVNNWPI